MSLSMEWVGRRGGGRVMERKPLSLDEGGKVREREKEITRSLCEGGY